MLFILKQLLISCAVIIAISISASAQGWRGIVPLRSNCDAVKRVLNIDLCRTGTYEFSEGSISISFSDGTCLTGWNVPAGTVISFYVHTMPPQKLDKTFPDLSQYVKSVDTHVRNIMYYTSQDKGVTIAAAEDGTISSVFYGPTTKDSSLQCTSNGSDTPNLPLASYKFDEFRVLRKEDEERRLNNFATELNAWTTVSGYIVGYPGRQGGSDVLDRIDRIRRYLIKHGISGTRLTSITGGAREESTIELYLVIK